LGKDRSSGHNPLIHTPGGDGSKIFFEVIQRALEGGWSREKIGSHVVRNNSIYNCDQAGICGGLGGAFSQIVGNHIYNNYYKRQFGGAEMAGIKIHAAIDMLIKGNRIHGNDKGMWLDWMAQGTRISGNLCYDNDNFDIFLEVNHGPFLLDNNLFLSRGSLIHLSEGGAYVHNLFAGMIASGPEPNRRTPYHLAHSTALAGLNSIQGGDDRFYNNLFVGIGQKGRAGEGTRRTGVFTPGYGLSSYQDRPLPLFTGGNVYYHNAQPYLQEANPLSLPETDPRPTIVDEGEHVYLQIHLGPEIRQAASRLVTTDMLGKAAVPQLPYENADGSPLTVNSDYFGVRRDAARPASGPFENPGEGDLRVKVW
jgi:hypothetical protein